MKGREDMDDMEILEKLTEKVQPKAKPEKKKRVVKRTDAKRASEDKYKKKNQKNVTVAFLPPTKDLYDHLVITSEKKGITPAQYIRELIREDMERND